MNLVSRWPMIGLDDYSSNDIDALYLMTSVWAWNVVAMLYYPCGQSEQHFDFLLYYILVVSNYTYLYY